MNLVNEYTDKKTIAVIGTRMKKFHGEDREETLELNSIRWNGKSAKTFDIRWWAGKVPLKGVTMNVHSLVELAEAIDTLEEL